MDVINHQTIDVVMTATVSRNIFEVIWKSWKNSEFNFLSDSWVFFSHWKEFSNILIHGNISY